MELNKQDMGPERGGAVAWGKTGENEGSMQVHMHLKRPFTGAQVHGWEELNGEQTFQHRCRKSSR